MGSTKKRRRSRRIIGPSPWDRLRKELADARAEIVRWQGYDKEHHERMGAVAGRLAKALGIQGMFSMEDAVQRAVQLAARMHDEAARAGGTPWQDSLQRD